MFLFFRETRREREAEGEAGKERKGERNINVR